MYKHSSIYKHCNIFLCSGSYQPGDQDLLPIQMVCQVLTVEHVSYAWIDGVNATDPVLLPLQSFVNFKRKGTLAEYLSKPIHLELGDRLEQILDLAAATQATPTVLVRAIEMMHSFGLDAEQALQNVREWGATLCLLDQDDRARALGGDARLLAM